MTKLRDSLTKHEPFCDPAESPLSCLSRTPSAEAFEIGLKTYATSLASTTSLADNLLLPNAPSTASLVDDRPSLNARNEGEYRRRKSGDNTEEGDEGKEGDESDDDDSWEGDNGKASAGDTLEGRRWGEEGSTSEGIMRQKNEKVKKKN